MKTVQTLEQRRAHDAWAAVQRAAKEPQTAPDYTREAKRLAVRILTAGLGHSIAFANAKDGVGKSVTNDVATWVLRRLKTRGGGAAKGPEQKKDAGGQLMEQIIENDADWLRRATEEALAYLRWLSRFAEAELTREDHQGTSGR